MIECTKCKIEKNTECFSAQRRQCKDCRANYLREIKKQRYLKNPKKYIDDTRQWRLQNIEKKQSYRKKEYEKNRTCSIIAAREYRQNNKDKITFWSRYRQLVKLERVPKWVDSKERWMIEEIYILARLRTKLTGVPWQVDHIIPLQGNLVSGLHTANNLQVILRKDNQSKGNKFTI